MYRSLKKELNMSAQVHKKLSMDGAGDINYSAIPLKVKCKIVKETKVVYNEKGEQIITSHTIYLDGDDTVSAGIVEQDKIVIFGKSYLVRYTNSFYESSLSLMVVMV